MTTPKDRAARMLALDEKATKGPWTNLLDGDVDLEFTVETRTLGPDLARDVLALEKERDNYKAQAESMAIDLFTWARYVGPCLHGRDPWDRCDECGEGDVIDVLKKRDGAMRNAAAVILGRAKKVAGARRGGAVADELVGDLLDAIVAMEKVYDCDVDVEPPPSEGSTIVYSIEVKGLEDVIAAAEKAEAAMKKKG